VSPRSISVKVYGARSAVDEITVADISAEIDYQRGSLTFAPRITLALGFAERVNVKSVEPQKVFVR
jgi:hypothetical protein